jgi:hypothetical protein
MKQEPNPTPSRGAPVGNDNAAKAPEELLSAVLNIKCHPSEKSAYVAAAGGQKLAVWIRQQLNKAAKHKP